MADQAFAAMSSTWKEQNKMKTLRSAMGYEQNAMDLVQLEMADAERFLNKTKNVTESARACSY